MSYNGMTFYSGFKSDEQIDSIIKTNSFQHRFFSKVKVCFPPKGFERIIHVFITCRLNYLLFNLDYCCRLIFIYNSGDFLNLFWPV